MLKSLFRPRLEREIIAFEKKMFEMWELNSPSPEQHVLFRFSSACTMCAFINAAIGPLIGAPMIERYFSANKNSIKDNLIKINDLFITDEEFGIEFSHKSLVQKMPELANIYSTNTSSALYILMRAFGEDLVNFIYERRNGPGGVGLAGFIAIQKITTNDNRSLIAHVKGNLMLTEMIDLLHK